MILLPTTVNLAGNGVQLCNDLVQSVTYQAFPSVSNQAAEVPIATAGYLTGHFFSGKNGAGTDFGNVSLDSDVSLLAYSGRSSVNDLLVYFFPPPSGTN